MKEGNIPEAAKRGKLIERSDPKPEIRKHAETAADWEYKEEAQYLYNMVSLFKDRFLDPIALTDRERMPDPVISFEHMRNYNTLAAYTLVRNPQGLLDEITFNTQHYLKDKETDKLEWEFGRWAQMETLLHEQVHLWQQNFGNDPIQLGRIYHNKEFVEKCESLGLHPKPGEGWHIKLADGPFEQLMKELGITKPEDLPRGKQEFEIDWFKWLQELKGKKPKGRSSLKKWCCPECGLNVRMGIQGNPELRHHPCEEKTGENVFLIRGDVYVAKNK